MDDELIINPYRESDCHLVTLDTGEYMDPEISNSLISLEAVGKQLHEAYVTERIENCTTPISDVSKRPKVYTFQKQPPVKLSKVSKIASYRASAAITTQMFLSLQARPEADMADFFKYENLQFPPSLSDKGKLRQGTKSGILDCIPGIKSARSNSERNGASVIVLDMPAVFHMMKPHKAEAFETTLRCIFYRFCMPR